MKVSSRETLMPTQSAQALDTEPGPALPVGISACLIYGTRGAVFPQVLLRRPLACTTHKLPESRFVRESKKKMPYQKFRKLFEQRPNPVVCRESHLAVQLRGQWRAGYALL